MLLLASMSIYASHLQSVNIFVFIIPARFHLPLIDDEVGSSDIFTQMVSFLIIAYKEEQMNTIESGAASVG